MILHIFLWVVLGAFVAALVGVVAIVVALSTLHDCEHPFSDQDWE